jgi:hypothetical protein
MKTFFRVIVVWYFYGGLAFGFIVWLSYVWGLHSAVSAEVPIAGRVKATWDIQTIVAPDVGTRVIAWGPSLAIWVAAPNGQTFGKWLAPGFYARRLSPAAVTSSPGRTQARGPSR